MKQKFLFLLTILTLISFSYSYSQNSYPCGIGFMKKYVVNTDKLNFRDKPSIKGNIIGQLHLNDTITTSANCEKIKDTIDSQKGWWIKTYYNGLTGFVWSHFIIEAEYNSKIHGQCDFYYTGQFEDPPKEVLIDLIKKDDCLGLFKNLKSDCNSSNDNFKLIKVSEKNFPKNLCNKIRGIDYPIFIISGLKTDNYILSGMEIQKMVFPGEQILFYMNGMSYTIYALGEVIKSKKQFPIIDSIKDYELRLRNNNTNIDHLLYRKQITSWGAGGYNDYIAVKWIGDINNDKKLDLITECTFHHEGGTYKLLLSNNTYYEELEMGFWSGP